MSKPKSAARAALRETGLTPRCLTALEAAAYCCAGSVAAFMAAVDAEIFPPPIRFKGSHPIWDRRALDAAMDRVSRLGLDLTAAVDPANDEVPTATRAAIRDDIANARL